MFEITGVILRCWRLQRKTQGCLVALGQLALVLGGTYDARNLSSILFPCSGIGILTTAHTFLLYYGVFNKGIN